jgi:hypothetical protein
MENQYFVSLSDDGGFAVSLSDEGLAALEAGSFSVALQSLGDSSSGGGSVSRLFNLSDVNTTNLTGATDKFVLTYDAPSNSFKFVNPDEVIDTAIADSPGPAGLTDTAIDYLDTALDDKIDLDGGTF